MTTPLSLLLPQVSDALAALVAQAAPWVAAIRVGGSRHIAGIVWRPDLVVTADQALPAQDGYSLSVSTGALLPGRVARRDPATNLVCLGLDTPAPSAAFAAATDPAVGSLALAIGAAADGRATVRLTAIHRGARGPIHGGGLGEALMLDLAPGLLSEGGPVLDARGGLLGMASAGPQGEALVVPYAAIARFLDSPGLARAAPGATAGASVGAAAAMVAGAMVAAAAAGGRRGWLGLALQPIVVPDTLRGLAGQHSGRMVVSITPGGPAELAGLRLGDVLLAIDGQSVSGQHGLRSFVGPERVGTAVDIRLMRDGVLRNTSLTIALLPER